MFKVTCKDKPCKKGQCIDKQDAFPNEVKYRCKCDSGWIGLNCETSKCMEKYAFYLQLLMINFIKIRRKGCK